MNYNAVIKHILELLFLRVKKMPDTFLCALSISCITKVQNTLESSNQQSYKKRIKVPCKHGFYVLKIGNTSDREASKVKL